MNWPWFLKPSDAASNVILVPSAAAGNIAVIFALRFGFDEIFAAIGFSDVEGLSDVRVVVALAGFPDVVGLFEVVGLLPRAAGGVESA